MKFKEIVDHIMLKCPKCKHTANIEVFFHGIDVDGINALCPHCYDLLLIKIKLEEV